MKIFDSKNINRICSVLLLLALAAGSLLGCAKAEKSTEAETEDIKDEDIELLEPVGVSSDYDTVVRRNIYDADVFSTTVTPKITEYFYTSDEKFGSYGKLPGEEVKNGEVLIYADCESIDEQIEEISESITDKAENYINSLSDFAEDLYDAKKNEYDLHQVVAQKDNEEVSENDPFYAIWSKGFMAADSSYKNAVLQRKKIEQNLLETEELYELERNYDFGRLERLNSKKENAFITSENDGVLVALSFLVTGDSVGKNAEICAVGDTTCKVMLTEYVNPARMNKAEDVYAIINGNRYEVTYQPISKEEYARLIKKDGVVYSEFIIDDPNDEISMGDFGDIVIVNTKATDVLSIAASSLTKEGNDYFVHRYNGEDTDYVPVTVGLRDSLYVEVLSGLSEGDKILSTEAPVNANKTAKLEKGSVSSDFSAVGFLYYPSNTWLTNPAKQGTVYLREIKVSKYEKVTKGQELATIEVFNDDVEIKSLERKILRHQERLVGLLNKKNKNYSDEIDRPLERAIKERERAIKDLQEQISKLKEYQGVIKIEAPCDGIITDVADLDEGELLYYKQRIVQVADEKQGYIILEDSDGRLTYGDTATIKYKKDGQAREAVGTVATVNKNALESGLKSDYALISIAPEDIVDMASAGSIQDNNGYWNRSRFNIEVTLRSMENVVLVPRSAVKDRNGDTYVKVKRNGEALYTGFIAGGSDKSYYWVAEGLSEGMEVCLE